MDCQRVFLVLTRGPFPSGSYEDAAVEQHLDDCFDCQRLAEALRPDEHLLRESVSLEESRDLPSYRGRLAGVRAGTALSLTDRAARFRIRPKVAASGRRRRDVHFWELSIALVLGLILASALRTLAPPSERPLGPADLLAVAAAEFSKHSTENRSSVAGSFELPVPCRLGAVGPHEPGCFDDPAAFTTAVLRGTQQSCTRCHGSLAQASESRW